MLIPPRNNLDYSKTRLDKIMSRHRLRFNPYSVSDSRLLEIVDNTGWGSEYDITQMVKLTFTRLNLTGNYRIFDGIYFKVANNPEELFLSLISFIYGVTTYDTLRRQRSFIGKKEIINRRDVENLVGKTVFVSRIIPGSTIDGSIKTAYIMHRLYGNPYKDAEIIRKAMIDAKLSGLQRILDYPESPFHISCNKGLFDFETRIQLAIDLIRHYPTHPIPPD